MSGRRAADVAQVRELIGEIQDVTVHVVDESTVEVVVHPTGPDLWLLEPCAFVVVMGAGYGAEPPRVTCRGDVSALLRGAGLGDTHSLRKRVNAASGRVLIPLVKSDADFEEEEAANAAKDPFAESGSDGEDDSDAADADSGYGWLVDYDLMTVVWALRGLFVRKGESPYTAQALRDPGGGAPCGGRRWGGRSCRASGRPWKTK